MHTLYPVSAFAVNGQTATTPRPLSDGARSLGLWLHRFHKDTGDVFATTRYFGTKVKRSERTVYRWLAELREHGIIETETGNRIRGRGKERHITAAAAVPGPLRRPLDAPKDADKSKRSPLKSGTMSVGLAVGLSVGLSGGLPVIRDVVDVRDNNTASAETGAMRGSAKVQAKPAEEVTGGDAPQELLDALCSAGLDADVARSLVRFHGESTCREQLEALPYRKAKDKAAVLVASIAGKWSRPAKRTEEQHRQQQQAQQAAQKAARAIVEQERAERAAEQAARLSGLSTGQREALERQAVALWQQEQPGAALVMLGRQGGGAVVQRYMLRLLDAGPPGVNG